MNFPPCSECKISWAKTKSLWWSLLGTKETPLTSNTDPIKKIDINPTVLTIEISLLLIMLLLFFTCFKLSRIKF